MSNLGPREKYGIILLGIVLIVFGMYMLGIRNLENSYAELTAERDNLIAQKEYYDALKEQNEEMMAQIEELNSKISDVEASFIPDIRTESIEQYVLSVFEENGCPYLVNISSSDIVLPQVVLPDGTLSDNTVVVKRITVEYSTTDGMNIPQYNRTNSVVVDGVPDGDLAAQYIEENMVWEGMYSRVGYDEFINSLVELEQVNPDCIKINSFGVTGQHGYVLLDAEIDFYAADFTDRVSEPNTNAPYIEWNGELNVATDAGFIGYPFIVDNTNSGWYNITLKPDDAASTDRPFATYWSTAIWQSMVNEGGVRAALGIEDEAVAPAEEPAE